MTEETRQQARRAGPAPEEGALPTHRLGQEFQNLATAVAERALSRVTEKVDGLAGRLTDYVENGGPGGLFGAVTGRQGGGPGALGGVVDRLTGGQGAQGLLKTAADKLGAAGGGGLLSAFTGDGGGGSHPVRAALMTYGKEKIKGLFGGGGGGKGRKGKKLKVTNIVESLDIGAPIRLVYNQWTQFEDWPSFMKKVETVEQKSDEKLGWKAQVFWSHRTWESTIIEQVPDSRIVWRSQGPKGWPDGSVTFHEVTPELTRVLLVLEYHPQGLFERTGNLWRAQGRRVRLEFKHFRRHVMTHALVSPDEIEGWRGEIRDSQVVKDHETALREEEEQEREGRAPAEEEEAPEEEAAEEARPEEEAEEEAPEEEAPEEAEEEEPYEEEEEEEEPEEEEEQRGDTRTAEAGRRVTRRGGLAGGGARAPERRRAAGGTETAERRERDRPRRGERDDGEESGPEDDRADESDIEENGEAEESGEADEPARRPVRRRRAEEQPSGRGRGK